MLVDLKSADKVTNNRIRGRGKMLDRGYERADVKPGTSKPSHSGAGRAGGALLLKDEHSFSDAEPDQEEGALGADGSKNSARGGSSDSRTNTGIA